MFDFFEKSLVELLKNDLILFLVQKNEIFHDYFEIVSLLQIEKIIDLKN